MHYNYMTGEQWRIQHSVSHRFPFRDKKDKHSALLLQEEKKTSSLVSWEAVGWAMVSVAEAFCFQTMIGAVWGSGAHKARKPRTEVCALGFLRQLIARGPCAPLQPSNAGDSGCLFLQGAPCTGGNEAGFGWILLCPWVAATSTRPGGAGPRSGLGYA